MKLNVLCKGIFHLKILSPQTVRIMKMIIFFMIVGCLQVSAKSFSQKITLTEKDATLEKVFREIERQSDYLFWYEFSLIDKA
ncbi:MAG: hypothetical protein ACRDE8_17600, partial [Ginsengibacter sp.]